MIMELIFSKILSSIIQIILFAAIPFIWWLCTARKKQKFTEWIGLKKIEGGFKSAIYTILATIVFLMLGAYTLYSVRDAETATSDFNGLGLAAVPAVLIYAVLNTSLPEEILFRGFLLKRMANKFGFAAANTVQAVLFGLLHGAMFFSLVGAVRAAFVIIFTGGIAWFIGYINEKKANGSIIPGWIIHAVSNIISGLCAAFLIFG